jgi:hypothetical protein
MSYRVHEENGIFKIIEKDSDLVVQVKKSKDDATKLCRTLNLGSGFDGWTPPFFAAEFYIQKEKPPK